MGWVMFFGCLFIAYGPAAAIFVLVIQESPRLVILTIGGAFFWLVSILLASIWWYIIPQLRTTIPWTIASSVLFQEGIRYLFCFLYGKAEAGFESTAKTTQLTTHPDHLKASLAFGLGSGIAQSLVTFVTLLFEATGPGSFFPLPSCPSTSIFLVLALFSFCFILLHCFWYVVFFEGYKQRNWFKMVGVVIGHLIASYITMLNVAGGNCVAAIIVLFVLTALTGGATLFLVVPRKPTRI
eukprot:TRINITY_DN10846_c0_g1_i1.p1 TRINITY_DN10846_c0_g1~~TRINITY_DN10846_c0_g1_i1.p1  ORF type:complete len:275 (+),score=3.51 TRINITY_DN10846_c0_g1_i1:109-825(+)